MKISVSAINGKMGRLIASLVHQHDITQLNSGLVRANSGYENQDLGELLGFEKINKFTTNNIEFFVEQSQAIIDFSNPQLSLEIAKFCSKHNKTLVCGTTGFNDEEKKILKNYAENTVIIWSANMSLGVNLLMNLVEKTANILRDDFDAEILEMHHNQKVDAPSGTALQLGLAIANGRNIDLKDNAMMSRVGKEAKRKKGEIGFATIRGGDVIGDHTVIFAGDGERIELAHKASNRDIFAKGAIRAAIWGSAQAKGFYSMRDVLA
jgi:4-hydroxy-tetrahydrodipicolinate reductase